MSSVDRNTSIATALPRRRTRPVRVGNVIIGGDHPVVVQSMINVPTRNVAACVDAIERLYRAGCEIVRVTAPTMEDARAIGEIRALLKRRGLSVPLAADVHHDGTRIAVEVARHVDKVRINPGLFVYRKRRAGIEYTEEETREHLEAIERDLLPVLEACRESGAALRIGVNHGSLSDRILMTYGDTPEGMVESALEFVRLCEKHDFRELVISLKASRVAVMIQANRLLARRMDALGMDYPIHLGVTEAGDGDYARIKSTAGIATLLAEGIGDTIRVSLSEDPLEEIPVCYDILQALGLRRTKTEFIACPSCGRTRFDLPTVLAQVKAATGHLAGLNIAVMGCIVNGPGEMADADYGYVGRGRGVIALYRGHELVKTDVPEQDGVRELVALIKADGRWVDPPAS
ncbi:MAG TPA: (E)-4-hydroxy-3-methylbut-2-enyl-diphosphate synthase [Armatimonadota bacterium]|nr:(E)-4-hydroxy-3-methylbut-2-enyl-diphosphate synthase [Armatimonadota bacterium]HOM83103.1 (E)-4-hydroxy-3-methylbut-2-enyl-diphosphate synthase [Armatimonadota bacterium]